MAKQKQSWLKGEIKHVQFNTTMRSFLEDLAREIITQEWITYKKDKEDIGWTFNQKREIKLRSSFKSQNIRLYKTTLVDGEYQKGDLLVEDTDYILIGSIIRGIGKSYETNTGIGDKVLIEVNYEAEEFQRGTFLEEKMPSGDLENILKLKSRPQGRVELYQDTIMLIKDEELAQKGGNEVYTIARTPISDAKGVDHELKITVNGVLKELDKDYKVEYFEGTVYFNEMLPENAKVLATYGYRTGNRGAKVDSSKYRIYNDYIIDISNNSLKNLDVVVDVDYYWNLAYPTSLDEIATTKKAIFETEVDISSARDWSLTKKYYWELAYIDKDVLPEDVLKNLGKTNNVGVGDDVHKNWTGIATRYGVELNEEKNTLKDDSSSDWVKFSWYKASAGTTVPTIYDKESPFYKGDVAIQSWISFTREHLNLVAQGNPSADNGQYTNNLISYGGIGMLKSYEGTEKEDLINNFMFTFGSDVHPFGYRGFSTKWGERTATGTSDISMYKTDSNMPYQAHYPAFNTTPEFMDKHFVTTSSFTGSHHMSEVTVVHSFERERGKIQNLLVGDRSSIMHLDELISNKDRYDERDVLIGADNSFLNKCGKLYTSEEKKWIAFNLSAPYSFLNNSPNVHYGIALRTE